MDEVELAEKLGVSVDELEEFLHTEIPYEQRIGMHDVINCDRCRKETHA